jgi:predicted RNA-binding protein with PUA-like domain
MQYWLMKSEPDDVSFDDVLASPGQTTSWYGVRNYQARNFIRDQMKIGDGVLFYHSSCPVPGVAGVAEIVSAPYADATQFDPKSPYYDPKATPEQPRWTGIDVKAVKQGRFVELKELRSYPELENMRLLAKGSRLSVMPVAPDEWRFILKLIGKAA